MVTSSSQILIQNYCRTFRELPPYPEALFPLRDGRSEKFIETNETLNPKLGWIKERIKLGWSPQSIFEELLLSVPRSKFNRYIYHQKLMKFASPRNLIHGRHEMARVVEKLDFATAIEILLH